MRSEGRRGTRTTVSEGLSTTARRGDRRRDSILGQPRARARGRPTSAPSPPAWGGLGATMRDTQADVPSAARPRAQLAFKDSMVHGILQFTPSIAFRYVLHRCESRDIRCRESFFSVSSLAAKGAAPRVPFPGRWGVLSCFRGSLARPAPGFCSSAQGRDRAGPLPPAGRGARGEELPAAPACIERTGSRVVLRGRGFDNDPSAGSPTETLLRLLLPLNDKVQWTSRDVAGGEPPTSPRSEHFTGPFNR